jgi:hypothetical protein
MKHQHNLKADLKKRDGHWLAKLRYRGWVIVALRFPDKDTARQWLHQTQETFHGSAIHDDIDRLKDLITETYQGDQTDE